MASLNQITDNILGDLGKPFDYVLSQRIKFAIKMYRSLYIRNDFEKNGGLNADTFVQRFTIPLIKVTGIDACGMDSLDCAVLRTQTKIPKPVRRKTNSPFRFVGSANGKESFSKYSITDLQYLQEERFSFTQKIYDYVNDYIFILTTSNLDFITVEDIFDEPDKVLELCINSDKCFSDDDDDFPIPMDMIARITEGILNGKIRLPKPDDLKVDINADEK